MQISLALEYHGWLDIHVSDHAVDYLIPASFLTDVIYDLLQRLSSLMEGAAETIIVIQTEPHECRIRIQRTGVNCKFEIFEFEDNFNQDDLVQGTAVFCCYISLTKLARKFLIEINKMRELGNEQFLHLWGYDFPHEAYQRYKQAWASLKS